MNVPKRLVTYRLLDFGDGRKLEQVGPYRLDRPSPAAEGTRRSSPEAWTAWTHRFDESNRNWIHRENWATDVMMEASGFVMPLSLTPFGHLGVFPEQMANWRWLQEVAVPPEGSLGLNLFAYTGASTMAMVASGTSVAHVDAAKPNVSAARFAAEANGWADRPIRYLVDDAVSFTRRESRRGKTYRTIVLDPPSYGHGPKSKSAPSSTWRLQRDLWPLLESCLSLLPDEGYRVVVTGHSPSVDQDDVASWFEAQNRSRSHGARAEGTIERGRLTIPDAHGRSLDAGFFARWWNDSSRILDT
ncbi:MAG: class I SAM-dependent methyltransferase [Planctomycetota bacterium]